MWAQLNPREVYKTQSELGVSCSPQSPLILPPLEPCLCFQSLTSLRGQPGDKAGKARRGKECDPLDHPPPR